MAPEPGQPDDGPQIAAAVQEISERASLLVREEIELAKAEIAEKVTKLVRGAVVGTAAGVFAVFGLTILLHGFAWLLFSLFFDDVYWGFFIVAGVLFLLAGLRPSWPSAGSRAARRPRPTWRSTRLSASARR